MVERHSKKSKFFVVEERTADTLVPLIEVHVTPGTIFFSDEWRSYHRLDKECYTHGAVKQSEEFKSKAGVCTNTVEDLWGLLK